MPFRIRALPAAPLSDGYFDWSPAGGATLTMNYKQFAADGSVIQGYKNHVFYPVTTADDDRVW